MRTTVSSRGRFFLNKVGIFLIVLALAGGMVGYIPYNLGLADAAEGSPTAPGEGASTYGAGTLVDLIAGQHIVAGHVYVSNDGERLSVTYATADGWMLMETHLAVSADEPGSGEWLDNGWQNRAGNPVPGRFPHKAVHDPTVDDTFTYVITLDGIIDGVGPDDQIFLGAQAVVYHDDEGREGAWGEGERFVERGNWAMFFDHSVLESDEYVETEGPEIIPPEIYTQRDMYEFARKLNEALPEEAAPMLADFADEFDIDPEARPEAPEDVHEVRIAGQRFVPQPGVDADLEEAIGELEPDQYFMAFLQLWEPASTNDYVALSEMGVRGLLKGDWIGHTTYIVALRAGAFPELAKLVGPEELIRWLGYYPWEWKIAVEYDEIAIALVSPVDSDRDEYRDTLAALGIEVIDYDETLTKYVLELFPEEAEELAQQWWVREISFMPPVELESEHDPEWDLTTKLRAQDSRLMTSVERAWLYFTGHGIGVGVRDTKPYYDEDNGHPDSPAFADGSHTWSDSDNPDHPHGTHVSGIIAARHSGELGVSGEYGSQGMAPDATLYTRDLDPILGYADDFDWWHENNVYLSNHSYWFGHVHPQYDTHVVNFDRYARDDGHIIVKSAGNQWGGAITPPGTGKNVIAVGAIRYVTDDDTTNRAIGGLAGYSSTGPALGRLKPELVAPGGQRRGDHGYHKYGVVSLNPADNTGDPSVWPEGDDHYLRMSGTSMAAPHVTGTLALMMQNWPGISSEAAKARLIGTTIPIKAGGDDPASGYANNDVGYGLVNAFNAPGLAWEGESRTLAWQSGTLTWLLDSKHQHAFDVPPGVESLVAVVAYNDVPGGDGDLINRLDFSISDGTTTHRHELPEGVTGHSTVEKMVVEQPAPGQWNASVEWTDRGSIFSFRFSQDYSIFVYALYRTPELDIVSLDMPDEVGTGDSFTVSMTVENTGGWIAAGVTAHVDGDDFGGQVGLTKNAGNLIHQGATTTVEFELEAPEILGSYQLQFSTDGVNRELEPVSLERDLLVAAPEIRDWYDLDAVRNHLDGDYILMNDLDHTTDGYSELASKGANEGKGWQPIGNHEDTFTGTFDGQGYEIGYLFVDRPDEWYVGLFGALGDGAMIENVGMVYASVTGSDYVGALVGRAHTATVDNSHATGVVVANDRVGGLVGFNQGTVRESYSGSAVISERNAGGLVGWNMGTVSDCYATGSVTGEFVVGGLVGWNDDGTVDSSFSTGSVTGEWRIGGLMGWNYRGTVSNSYATGTVTRSTGSNTHLGGFVGYNDRGRIINCYSTGSVHYEGATDPTDKGFAGRVWTDGDYEMSGNFWDTQTSGQSSTEGDATGKTTEEMQDITTFTDTETEGLDDPWDITGVKPGTTNESYVWNIVNGESYPFLSWEFDFSISLDPDSGMVVKPLEPGETASVSTDAKLELILGETQPVTIAVSNAPAGVTVTFPDGNICSPDPDHGCSITVVFDVDHSAPVGGFYVTFTATGGGMTRSAVFRLTIEGPMKP